MKNINKLLAILLVFAMTVVCPASAFAEDLGTETQAGSTEEKETVQEDTSEPDETETDQEESKGKGALKAWKQERNAIKEQRAEIEGLKDEAEKQIDDLEAKLEQAELSKDAALIESLKGQLEALKTQKDSYQAEMKQKIEQMKQIVREKYTEEELKQLSLVGQTLSSLENVQVLPVENLIVKNRDVKFDIPPVIKQGRTLIPVRAIAESTGATVNWNSDEQTVTIVKGDKTIVFNLSIDTVYVNGVETKIDMPAEVMSNRTMVPMRFIAENFGLNVDWDQETQTIEITDETAEDATEEAAEETAEAPTETPAETNQSTETTN